MPKVKDLKIQIQTGSDQYFASWEFDQGTRNNNAAIAASSGTILAGDLVTIKSGATWYNGAGIPDWVMSDRWYVYQVNGDRAVLNSNADGSNEIMSPINVAYLSGGSGSGGSSYEPEVDISTLDHYTVDWRYSTGDGPWFEGSTSDTTETNNIYSPPTNAIATKVVVTPVSKTYKVDNEDVYYWTGTAAEVVREKEVDAPEQPGYPTVTLDKYTITAELDRITQARYDKIEFDVIDVSNGGENHVAGGKVTVKLANATFKCTVSAGGEYRVRCRAINLQGTDNKEIFGPWSELSDKVVTVPNAPTSITVCKATSATEVHLEWASVSSATKYEIEYATKLRYFDSSDQTTTIGDVTGTHREVAGLDSGSEYFFRLRAVNDSGESAWTEPISVILGKAPSAPTTWSSTTTAVVGSDVTLFWVHNSQDNSSQTYADLELVINGKTETHTIKNTTDEDLKDKTSSYILKTSSYSQGTTIVWRVRTAGVTKEYGEWSSQRQIDVYAPVTLQLSLTNQNGASLTAITSYPFYLRAFAGPSTQAPVGYHVSVASNTAYSTVDAYGNRKNVNVGEEVYSRYFDTTQQLIVEFTPINISLKNGVTYTISCTVAMNSGLTKEETIEFTPNWSTVSYEPDAEIGIDKTNWVAYIRPYCITDDNKIVDDVYLSVYRIAHDGEYIEIATDVESGSNTYITDPHPSLDFARYRITAKSKETGVLTYYDVPQYPVGCNSIIVQWDDDWANFNSGNGDTLETSPWGGMKFVIPYDIDVSDTVDPDITLAEYAGREHPVSYYGTQKGFTSSWSFDVPKEDTSSLYLIRKLQVYMGDCYVREPSGTGYWAHVKVDYNRNHNTLIIPVTFDITRVEGGM